jgi:hypothetical protein
MTTQIESTTGTTTQLLRSLVAQQDRVPGILAGLDEEALRRPVLPSGWSCLGMVQHLTGMTRFWFVQVMAGGPVDDPIGDSFVVPVERSSADVVGAFRTETEQADLAIQRLPLTASPAWWPDGLFGDWRLDNLEEVLLHVIVETACHCGHLDAARELIDGRTWDWEHGRLADPA